MRHFLVLVICAGLVWMAVGAVPYWVNSLLAGAMLHKPPTPPTAAATATARCHLDQSSVAVLVPLVLAWLIRIFSLRGEVMWVRLLRASMEMILLFVAFWFVCFAYPLAHPLTPLFIERCGPLPLR